MNKTGMEEATSSPHESGENAATRKLPQIVNAGDIERNSVDGECILMECNQ